MTAFVTNWVSADADMAGVVLNTPATVAAGVAPPYPLSKIIEGTDPSLGFGRFMYLQASEALLAGDMCEAIAATLTFGSTIIAGWAAQKWRGTTLLAKPLAVAVAAMSANQFGWFQVFGAALVNSNGAVAANSTGYWQANGVVSTTIVASKQAVGMIAMVANSANFGGLDSAKVVTATTATQSVWFLDNPVSQPAIT